MIIKKNCKASNGWWKLLNILCLGMDEPIKVQSVKIHKKMSSINPEACGSSYFIQVKYCCDALVIGVTLFNAVVVLVTVTSNLDHHTH